LIDFKDRPGKLTSTIFCVVPYKPENNTIVQRCSNKVWFPARTAQSGIRSFITETIIFVISSASIGRDAVLMKKDPKKHWSVSLTT
jgi:hypothetical protein